jgi:hypothetical protein
MHAPELSEAARTGIDPVITVRRFWGDWQTARNHLSDISGLHWSGISGEVQARQTANMVVIQTIMEWGQEGQ